MTPRIKNGWLILRSGDETENAGMEASGDMAMTDAVVLMGQEGWKKDLNCLVLQSRDRDLATVTLNGPDGEQIHNGSAKTLGGAWRAMLTTAEAKYGSINEKTDAPVEALR
jgi:hypothetical protein